MNEKDKKIKEIDPLSKIIKSDWAKKIIGKFVLGKKEVLTFTDIKKVLKSNNKVVTENIKKLCKVGILEKNEDGRGYKKTELLPLNYVFKLRDISVIEKCPINNIFSLTIPYKKTANISETKRAITFYGFEKRNEKIEEKLSEVYIDLLETLDINPADKKLNIAIIFRI